LQTQTITWLGSELYHFRVEVLSDTHCRLHTEFVVFVTHPPIGSTEEALIISCTAYAIGLSLLLAYLTFVRKHGRRVRD
jgi:hypothetical protein